jgi:hypothetical protein
MPPPTDAIRHQQDFSLVLGGPLYQFLRRVHLSGDGLELVRQRLLAIVAFIWLPLLVLSVFEGQSLDRAVAIPFLWDVEANARFLVALPLLIVAEVVVHDRIPRMTRQFVDRKLVADQAQFDAALASAFRLRNSLAVEVLLVAFVYGVGIAVIWRHYMALATTATWYAMPVAGGMTLSLTGTWYAFVSLPAFQFLFVRWYFRIFVWARFLWHVSHMKLTLIPAHPDRVGGLGFLTNVAYAFTPLALAHGTILAGPMANRIFYVGAALAEFKAEVASLVVFVLILVLGPLLVFSPQLAAAKRAGLAQYGRLASRYVREFEAKWIQGAAPHEPLVGTADIQSLADLGNSFEVVKTMRIVPITRNALLPLVIGTLAPIVPLALTMMSLEELVKKLFGLFL